MKPAETLRTGGDLGLDRKNRIDSDMPWLVLFLKKIKETRYLILKR